MLHPDEIRILLCCATFHWIREHFLGNPCDVLIWPPKFLNKMATATTTEYRRQKIEYSVDKPLNKEPPVKKLISSFITPEDAAYDRNHGPIPHLAGEKHRVVVDGIVSRPLSLSMEDLRTKYPQHEVICALQCAGNRRHTMRTLLKEVEGIDWMDAAVMNCKWKGPRLRDILNAAGVRSIVKPAKGAKSGLHVAFSCYAVQCQNDDWFGGSIDLDTCLSLDAEVILALEMNDKPLSPKHGYPVRVVIPGVAGARWVKWLDRITVQQEESSNFYEQHDYKILPPEVVDSKIAEKYWNKVPPMTDMPINSVIAVPDDNETVNLSPSGTIEVRGYAVPRGNQGPVTRVEVSTDDGKSWSEAEIQSKHVNKWSWVLWKASIRIEKGRGKQILSRATDAGGNTQQKYSQWNLRGVGYNGYGVSRNLTIV
ncbi:hypothetical protein DTO271D3_3095 [Paecilomyces variotii]|nr:hypothetical protein DTO271D3_3095 [Paecilomyces variotii]